METDISKEQLKTTRVVVYTAVGVMTLGCAILVAALVIPPPGEIHNSVLVAFGEISTFAGTLLGVIKLAPKSK